MPADDRDENLIDRLSRQGEEAIGRLAEELVENPLVSAALSRALDAREGALKAQEAAMGALGIPSAADIERLTRRVRSVSQRLEGIEDAVDRLDERLASLDGLNERLDALTTGERGGDGSADALAARIEEIARDVAALRGALSPDAEPLPRAQERLSVTES